MMKKKGFTLVELLIVIAILGVLAAMMSLSTGKAVGTAKATSIMNNMAAARQAGLMYYTDNMNTVETAEDGSDKVDFTVDLLKDNYIDIDNFASTNTKYTAYIAADKKGLANAKDWAIYCDYSGEPDKDEISAYLNGNATYRGCALTTTNKSKYIIKMNVISGKASAYTTATTLPARSDG